MWQVNHGKVFHTDTDSEVVPVLCNYLYGIRQPADFMEVMRLYSGMKRVAM